MKSKKHLKDCIDHYKCTRIEDHAAGKHLTAVWWCGDCVAELNKLTQQMNQPMRPVKLNLKKKTRVRKILDKLMGIKCRSCDYDASNVDELLEHERDYHPQFYAGSQMVATAHAYNMSGGNYFITQSGGLNRGT